MSKGNKNKKIKNDMEKAELAKQEAQRQTASLIEAILNQNGYALQPFIQYSEFGIAPRVRLVENKQPSNGKESSETEVEGAGDEDGASEPVSA